MNGQRERPRFSRVRKLSTSRVYRTKTIGEKKKGSYQSSRKRRREKGISVPFDFSCLCRVFKLRGVGSTVRLVVDRYVLKPTRLLIGLDEPNVDNTGRRRIVRK